MISFISANITNWLIHSGLAKQDDYEIYSYAAYCLLLGLAPFFIVLALGFWLDMIFEGIMLLIPVVMIRKFSGGFHLQSARKCLLSSTIILGSALLISRYIIDIEKTSALSFLVLLSVTLICFFSPIDSDARKLSFQEHRFFRLVAQILSFIALLLFFLLLSKNALTSAVPFGLGIVIVAALQLPCVYYKKTLQHTLDIKDDKLEI